MQQGILSAIRRTDRIDCLTPSNNPFDYIDLAYDPVGMITERKRKDAASWYKTVYTYDNAYRLSGETNRTAADVYQTSRTYGYDAGGNRSWMTIQNSGSVNKTTTYAYGNRNQLVSNTGYYREGTTDTGAMTYAWDAKGNMLTRTGQSHEWNEDNRLTRVWVSSGDPKQEILQKFYKYDSAGRRILSHTSLSSQRTRHFFNGLTEEIRKVSLGTHADTSFTYWSLMDGTTASGWIQGVGTGGSVTSQDNATRFSKVLKFTSGGRFDRSFSARSEKAFSFWFKHELYNHSVVLWASTSAGARRNHERSQADHKVPRSRRARRRRWERTKRT